MDFIRFVCFNFFLFRTACFVCVYFFLVAWFVYFFLSSCFFLLCLLAGTFNLLFFLQHFCFTTLFCFERY